jgi:hypothetical protein
MSATLGLQPDRRRLPSPTHLLRVRAIMAACSPALEMTAPHRRSHRPVTGSPPKRRAAAPGTSTLARRPRDLPRHRPSRQRRRRADRDRAHRQSKQRSTARHSSRLSGVPVSSPGAATKTIDSAMAYDEVANASAHRLRTSRLFGKRWGNNAKPPRSCPSHAPPSNNAPRPPLGQRGASCMGRHVEAACGTLTHGLAGVSSPMLRRCSCVIALAVMLVGLPTAQAADTTLKLACQGTVTPASLSLVLFLLYP